MRTTYCWHIALILMLVGMTGVCLGGNIAARLERCDPGALRMAVEDMSRCFPARYANGQDYLARLDALAKRLPRIREAVRSGDQQALDDAAVLLSLQREALLANPLLDFGELLVIKRVPIGDPRRWKNHRGIGAFIGLPQQSSWQLHRIDNPLEYENEICILSDLRGTGTLTPLYRPPTKRLLSGLELHFDADRLLFAMIGNDDRHWQIYEIGIGGGELRQLTADGLKDVHSFDPCYLPDGRIVFESTAPFQGVPCNPTIRVAMSYIMHADGSNIRQLTFEQDHNYYPRVMNDGRVMYLRWEYTDIPHVWGRYLFTMNPDGTGQRAFYGSGSYWPNSIFFARPVPNCPTRVVGIVTGHHEGRDGELTIFDPTLGRSGPQGVVQQIPRRGIPVKPEIEDKLTEGRFPRFLQPYPLTDPLQRSVGSAGADGKYFLVSCKPTPDDLWGIYLVDVFDNMVLVKELEDHVLLEPIPLRSRKTPPAIPDTVNLAREDALMYIEDIYRGPGLKGVPHGSVKALRLYTYHFAYNKIVGISNRVGTNGPWEPKRILGTVPVDADGSAFFRVPANTPISIQPLDAEGKALQLMRSWTTAMPGELVSCVGCHEHLNEAVPNLAAAAVRRTPSEIQPWRGPVRGFSFKRDVQPALDKYCVGCHNGRPRDDGKMLPDLRGEQGRYVAFARGKPDVKTIAGKSKRELLKTFAGVFEPAFIELRRYVRVGGLESDLRQQSPGEFHADTSELIQMLIKGHHGVRLDDEAWDRLVTWIDLNAPCHGTWGETAGMDRIRGEHGRRQELQLLYGSVNDDPEHVPNTPAPVTDPVIPVAQARPRVQAPVPAGWPFAADEAKRRQRAAAEDRQGEGTPATRTLDLGDGMTLELVMVPPGRFVMGDRDGEADETPHVVQVDKPFWIGRFEITNEQYARFDPSHDSRYEHAGSMIFSEHNLGPLLNGPRQPALRISWQEAVAFCDWLSRRAGQKVSLPTEAQWEYACRAGTRTPWWYGDGDVDFSRFANMADMSIRKLAHWGGHDVPDLIPRDTRFDDGFLVTADVGKYAANAWGLHDMHGSLWEWTLSAYAPYPYRAGDGRNSPDKGARRVVRGGSWNDRPKRCRSAFRLSYPPWQKIYNVGFRVAISLADEKDEAARQPVRCGATETDSVVTDTRREA